MDQAEPAKAPTPELSILERKVLWLLSDLGEYEKIEIKKVNGIITVVRTTTTKEEFPT